MGPSEGISEPEWRVEDVGWDPEAMLVGGEEPEKGTSSGGAPRTSGPRRERNTSCQVRPQLR